MRCLRSVKRLVAGSGIKKSAVTCGGCAFHNR
ncbi:hypothetical protein Pvag_0707 [Pantoea vagans C9-1]|nr:hypothetical protein Pvag_0707 [Pantoea vagans C9-1]